LAKKSNQLVFQIKIIDEGKNDDDAMLIWENMIYGDDFALIKKFPLIY
jgi:hypothetical protein